MENFVGGMWLGCAPTIGKLLDWLPMEELFINDGLTIVDEPPNMAWLFKGWLLIWLSIKLFPIGWSPINSVPICCMAIPWLFIGRFLNCWLPIGWFENCWSVVGICWPGWFLDELPSATFEVLPSACCIADIIIWFTAFGISLGSIVWEDIFAIKPWITIGLFLRAVAMTRFMAVRSKLPLSPIMEAIIADVGIVDLTSVPKPPSPLPTLWGRLVEVSLGVFGRFAMPVPTAPSLSPIPIFATFPLLDDPGFECCGSTDVIPIGIRKPGPIWSMRLPSFLSPYLISAFCLTLLFMGGLISLLGVTFAEKLLWPWWIVTALLFRFEFVDSFGWLYCISLESVNIGIFLALWWGVFRTPGSFLNPSLPPKSRRGSDCKLPEWARFRFAMPW